MPIYASSAYPLGLDDEMPFGTFRGDPIWEVLEKHPDYIEWCMENVDGFELDNEAYDFYKKTWK